MDILAGNAMLMLPFGSNWTDESSRNLDDITQAALKHFMFIFCLFLLSKWLLWISSVLALGLCGTNLIYAKNNTHKMNAKK